MRLPIIDAVQRNFRQVSQEYKDFAQDKDSCRKCGEYNHYQQVIQSEGCVNSPTFMIIGEAPGADEIEQNRPFVGQAGQRLRQSLKQVVDTFNVSTTLISNTMSCRPLQNKLPKDKNIISNCCDLWLMKEISIVRPKILILLGNTPLEFVGKSFGITTNRGKWLPVASQLSLMGVKGVIATFHPSYVIRCERMKNTQVPKQFDDDFLFISQSYKTL